MLSHSPDGQRSIASRSIAADACNDSSKRIEVFDLGGLSASIVRSVVEELEANPKTPHTSKRRPPREAPADRFSTRTLSRVRPCAPPSCRFDRDLPLSGVRFVCHRITSHRTELPVTELRPYQPKPKACGFRDHTLAFRAASPIYSTAPPTSPTMYRFSPALSVPNLPRNLHP
jgi:hypothetical protein